MFFSLKITLTTPIHLSFCIRKINYSSRDEASRINNLTIFLHLMAKIILNLFN
jgi:hypothetical protein